MQAQSTASPLFGDDRLPPRFWAKVQLGPVPAHRPDLGPCWEWTASHNQRGYGQFASGSRKDDTRQLVLAHRHAYLSLIGPIPEGLEPDHLCRNHACTNPLHVELISHRLNVLRGVSPSAQAAQKTHCPQGHPYSGANLCIRVDGRRQCRSCRRERDRRYRSKAARPC